MAQSGYLPASHRIGWERSEISPCETSYGRIGTGTCFSLNTSKFPFSIIPPVLYSHSFNYHRRTMFFTKHFSFPCQYHFTNTLFSFIYLPPTLYNVLI